MLPPRSFAQPRLFVVPVAVVFVACTSVRMGTKVSRDDLGVLERGVTTQNDVRRTFGEPTSVRVSSDGTLVWRYEYEEVRGHDTGTLARLACAIGRFVRIPACLFQPLSYREEVRTRDQLTVSFGPDRVLAAYAYTHEEMPLSGVYDPAVGAPGSPGRRGPAPIPSTMPVARGAP